jgi:Fe(3+) dicitrate transport protein
VPSAEAPPVEPSPVEPVEVTVAGTSLAKTAGSAHVVNKKQLERFEYDDPHAALSTVPGVYVRGEDGMGLRPNIGIRGVNPDRSKKLALMEDGVLFGPAPYSAPAAYYFPILTRMVQLRVIKGPAAVSYGPSTVGGALDLVTRPIPSSTSGGIDLAGGQYFYRKGHGYFGSSTDQVGFLIEGVHLANDGFKKLPNDGDTGFYRDEFMAKVSYRVDPEAKIQNELRLKLTYSEELSNETYLGLTDAEFREDPLQRYGATSLDRMRNHRTSVVLTHVLEPTQDVKLTTNVYRHDFYRIWRKVNRFRGADLFNVLSDPETPQNEIFHDILTGEADSATSAESLMIGPNERDFTSQGIETRLDWAAETGALQHRIESGLRFHNDKVDRRHSEDAFVLIGGEPVPEGTATQVTAFNEAWSYAFAAHAMDAVTWKALTVTPGVRVEAIRSGFEDRIANQKTQRWAFAALPGLGAFYALTPELGVLAGVYRGFTPPVPGGDKREKPELSVNYEAGARYVNRIARVEAIGFFNDYQNLSDVCTFSSGCAANDLDRQFNAGKAQIYGLEAYAELSPKVGTLTLPLTVAYTLTQTEFRSTFTSDDPIFGDVQKGDEMPYVPRHQATVTPGVEHELAGANLSFRFVSRMREVPGTGPVTEADSTDQQFTIDAGTYVQPWKPLRLYANATNLLDSHDIVSRRPFGARPNAPRWVMVGAKLSF